MAKKDVPIPLAIFIAGFAAGMISGIGTKTGIEPDELGIRFFALEKICEATTNANNPITLDCGVIGVFGAILSIGLGVLIAFVQANRIGNWKIGLGIYIFGWILGILWIATN